MHNSHWKRIRSSCVYVNIQNQVVEPISKIFNKREKTRLGRTKKTNLSASVLFDLTVQRTMCVILWHSIEVESLKKMKKKMRFGLVWAIEQTMLYMSIVRGLFDSYTKLGDSIVYTKLKDSIDCCPHLTEQCHLIFNFSGRYTHILILKNKSNLSPIRLCSVCICSVCIA